MPELVILGSSGWMPTDVRMTTSLALRFGEHLVIFDAGTGLARLKVGPLTRLLPQPDAPIHVFLSHMHLDHTIGLTYIPALWHNPTIVHVPQPEQCVDEPDPLSGGPSAIEALFGGPLFPTAFADLLPDISQEAAVPGRLDISGLGVTIRRQDHPGKSLGYRVGDLFAFVTDTPYDEATIELARGAKILIHEAWTTERDDPGGESAGSRGHSSAKQAAALAAAAEVEELLLIHLPPTDPAYHAEMLADARELFTHTELCSDGMTRRL